tara:strand:- start:1302 stop:2021 length:720 start_codon:yes stop_codon:yes gene_type:complete
MKNIYSIAYKELLIYFSSPMAYIIAGVFFSLTGVFFVSSIEGAFAEASARVLFSNSTYFLMPLIPPLLTMRLLAEEQKLGTLELLLTSPIRDYEIVIAKFLASFIILLAMTLFTLFYMFLLFIYNANPDIGPMISTYIGFILYAMVALSIGLLASSLTSNQIVAASVGFGIIFLFTILHRINEVIEGPIATIIEHLSLLEHFESFSRGVIDTKDVAYFIVMTCTFIFLTVRSLESRRWR